MLLPVLLAVGCHHMPNSPDNGPWHVSLQVSPPSPSPLDQARFTVRVVDHSGRPVDGAQVTLKMTMATMDMGTTILPLQASGPGEYSSTGSFGMAGKWNMAITVSLGGRSETQTISYDLNPGS